MNPVSIVVGPSILKSADASGDTTASGVDRSIVTAGDIDGTADASKPTGISLKSTLIHEDGGFSADSGSTTTEESFPGDSSREEDYGSGGDGSHGGGATGVGIGGGVTMLPNGRKVSVDSLTTDASLSVTEAGEKVLPSTLKSVCTEADAVLAVATVAAGDAPPVPVTPVEAKDENRDSVPSPLPPPLLFSNSADASAVTEKKSVVPREVGNGPTGRLSPEGGGEGGETGAEDVVGLPRSEDLDPALACALDEAVQAKAEIEAAEAAEREAARLRVRDGSGVRGLGGSSFTCPLMIPVCLREMVKWMDEWAFYRYL